LLLHHDPHVYPETDTVAICAWLHITGIEAPQPA
jgi:hypothetical protein